MTSNELHESSLLLKSLKDVRDSKAWIHLCKVLNDDVVQACFQMADNPAMTEKEIDFRRGAISAARNFSKIIDIMIVKTESEILMASADMQTLDTFNAKAI